jgi:hypothetical protein
MFFTLFDASVDNSTNATAVFRKMLPTGFF